MKNKKIKNSFIIQGVSVVLVFILAVAFIIAAVFMFSTKGDFVNAFEREISSSFYLSAVVIILISSALFTPFSFGISNYFLKSSYGNGNFKDIFYLFKSRKMLVKAVIMNTVKLAVASYWRTMLLAFAVVIETVVFVVTIVLRGENIFDYEQNFFENVMSIMQNNTIFAIFTVLLWIIVLVCFVLIKIKFIFCKYALIRFNSLGIIEAVRVGSFCARGKLLKTARFYIKYLSIYISLILTLGISGLFMKNKKPDSFSLYAVKEVEQGIDRYFERRNC